MSQQIKIHQGGQEEGYRRMLRLAGPLVLSQASVMVMQVTDAMFVSRYSQQAVAALGVAGITFWVSICLFVGWCGYAGTLVSQYVGAQKNHRVGSAVWQGIYLALTSGLLVATLSLAASALFGSLGHSPQVTKLEEDYFRICCWGGWIFLLGAAVSGFFSGRHDNMRVLAAHLAGVLANVLGNWLLIFGNCGFPEMGLAGAAWATVMGQTVTVMVLMFWFLKKEHRQHFATWQGRKIDWPMLGRLCKHGIPAGLRLAVEVGVWAVFLVFVGRVGDLELAASSITWRINTMAFFPVIGLSIAVGMMVGQAKGADDIACAERAMKRGLVLSQIWMMSLAALFFIWPNVFISLFLAGADEARVHAQELGAWVQVLMRYMAAYCLLDGVSIILLAGLQSAGDTRWTMLISTAMYTLFLTSLWLIDHTSKSLHSLWTAATVFVCVFAFVWWWRFKQGQWKTIHVIEEKLAGE